MNIQKTFEVRSSNLDLLAGFVRDRAKTAIIAAGDDGYPIGVIEGWRSPGRQETLYASNKPDKWVTDKRAWQSSHQYGLAIDIAYRIKGQWSYDGSFDKLGKYFLDQGFKWLAPKELGHYEITAGIKTDEMLRISREFGLQALWEMIRTKI